MVFSLKVFKGLKNLDLRFMVWMRPETWLQMRVGCWKQGLLFSYLLIAAEIKVLQIFLDFFVQLA